MYIMHFPFYLLAFVLIQQNTALSLQGDSDIPKQVLPNPGIKNVLDLSKYPNARCLDGTPGAYYFSPTPTLAKGSRHKFYIFKMGGDICLNYQDCLDRSRSDLGSTSSTYGYESILDLAGASNHSITSPHVGFRRDPHLNPLLWDWNHIYLIYCDGGYYAGSNSTPTYVDGNQIFFNGADIMSAILDDLAEKYELTSASDILVGGCSAGGLSTFATADWIFRHAVIPTNARKAGISCSGFFLESGSQEYYARFPFSYNAMNLTASLSAKCVETIIYPHNCIIPEASIKFTRTPLFIWNSIFDEWVMHNEYGMDCTKNEYCVKTSKFLVTRAIFSFLKNSRQSGGFLDGCEHHCEDSRTGDVDTIQPIDGAEPLQALSLWYNSYIVGENVSAQRMWYKDANFPCPDCCPGGLKEKGASEYFLEPLKY